MTSERLRCVTRIVLALVLSLALGGFRFPSRALADADADAQYRQLIEQALAEFGRQNWPEARVLFRQAHALSPNARTLRGMGVVSFEMRDYVEAVRDLSAALTDTRQALTRDQQTEVQTLLTRARTFVGRYTLHVEPVQARLRVDGSDAELEADGTLLLPFGEHTVEAAHEGYERARTQVIVKGGEQGELSLVLHETQPEPVSRANEPTPIEAPSAAPAPAPEVDVPGGFRYAWVALGATAAFGGAAAVLWFLGDEKLQDLDDRCAADARRGTPCQRGDVDTSSVERFQMLTNVALGLTGGALIGTVVLAIVEWPEGDREDSSRLSVGFGPRSLSLYGAF